MKTIKTIAALFFILLLATQPDEIVLWGIMLAACAGVYWAAERSTEDEPNRKRAAKMHT